MLSYIGKRLLLMIPTILGVLTLTFLVIQLVPGGPVDQLVAEMRAGSLGEGAGSGSAARRDLDAKQIEEIKKLYGFDKPPLTRYFEMLWNFARFDLGRSFMHNKDVWQLIKEKLPVSISLGLWTFLLSYLISIPLGIAKAVREGSRFDTATTMVALLGFALPGFALGVLLIVLFAGGTFLDWFPLRGLTSENWASLSWPARIVDYLWHLVLPLTCYAIGSFAIVTFLTKNTFVEEIRKQYVLVARAKGVSEATRAVQARVPQCADTAGHGPPGCVRGRVLRGIDPDRNAFLAGWTGSAELRIDRPPRLSRRAGVAVLLHAAGPRRQAHRAISSTSWSIHGCNSLRRANEHGDATELGPAMRRPQPANAVRAIPSRSPNQRAWARFKRNRLGYASLWIFAVLLTIATFGRTVQQRSAPGRALPGRMVPSHPDEPARNPVRRRLPDADRLARPVHPPAVRKGRQLGAVHVQSVCGGTASTISTRCRLLRLPAARTCSAPMTAAGTWWHASSTAFASASGSGSR